MKTDKSEYLKDLSKCVRCGGCKAVCPTYDEEGSEAMGARGRVALLRGLLTGQLRPSRRLNELIFSCILCGACSGTCPLGVDIPEAVLQGRVLLSKKDIKRWHLRALLRFYANRPDMSFRMLKWAEKILLPVLQKKGLIPFVPGIPEVPLKKADQVRKVRNKNGRVAIFTGCSTNYLLPHLGESLINILQRFGYEVVLPKGEACCGSPFRAMGLEDEAVEQAKKNFRFFSRLKVDAILSPCPTCTLTLRNDYPRLIGKGLEKAMDIAEFFMDKLPLLESIETTAVYHDPCHLYYGLGVKKQPREIIKKAGIQLKDSGKPGCCGLGGLFSFSYKETSEKLLEKSADRLLKPDADTVITSCPGCILQLSRTIIDRPVVHLIEVIEEAYCFRTQGEKLHKEEGLLF